MGLFDFARNIGKKVFGGEDDDQKASAKLQEHIAKANPGVENLQVAVKDGVATIKGDAKSPEALEKAILMAGNAMGVQEVQAAEATVAGTQQVQLGGDDEFYIIEKGDSLWKIAEKAYGNGAKYTAIFEANREVIEDPDKIFPGQKIRIPKSLK
ncbi:MAG: peptidoglycan-binding protein LysM [Thiothrix sp.]|nr:peptidoglycan-binding protein LysM [Thiothrix sp.]HPQ96085.1 peptidoglycan-binding protein LysM [Thiolinea sp.]